MNPFIFTFLPNETEAQQGRKCDSDVIKREQGKNHGKGIDISTTKI